MVCKVCGAVNDDASRFCETCGTDLTAAQEVAQEPVEQIVAEDVTNEYEAPAEEKAKDSSKGLSIASLVMGILGFLSCYCGGFVLSVIGLILGFAAKKKQEEKNAVTTAAVIINAITVVVGLILTIICFVFVGAFLADEVF